MGSYSLKEVAAWVGGQVVGAEETRITGAAILRDAVAGELTLVDCADRLRQFEQSPAAAAMVPQGISSSAKPVVQVADVHRAFAQVVARLRPPSRSTHPGISPQAWIDPRAEIASDVSIFPGAWIGAHVRIGPGSVIHSGVRILDGCRIGSQVTIFPNAVLYEDTVVGDRCLIHAGAVLGAYGFGYETRQGRHELSAQLGYVVLEDDVEIGANTTVDRGTYGPTVIGQGTKIDNLVMVAHNCRIGRHNLICSQVGIAGSVTTGDYVVMAGQVGVRDHVHIGTQAVLGAMAGIINNVPEKTTVIGIPATEQRDQKIKQAAFAKLPEMRKQLRALQRQVEQLQQRLDSQREAA